MKPKYEIGQEIIWPSFNAHHEDYVVCPDCGGTGRLRVTFHDETTVSIPCTRCASGYYDPIGKIKVYCRRGEVKRGFITGIEISDDVIEYRVQQFFIGDDGRPCHHYNIVKETEVCSSVEEARVKADGMAFKYDEEEREKIFKKEKDMRSWAWNASYHRKEIKEAEKKIEYHSKKLAHASLKAKEPLRGDQ